tara:strand:+ start:191 stop:415 length:225 start_codon:yes stop_codon:yes gene_type:complete
MITESDSWCTVNLGIYYAILPSRDKNSVEKYCKLTGAKPVIKGFSYNSGSNPDFLSIDKIRELKSENIDPDFMS